MSVILTRGRVPRTPHTEYYSEPEVLALEEIHGAAGFSGDWSRKYHYRKYPTQQIQDPHRLTLDLRPQPLPPLPLQPWHLRTGRLKAHGDVISGRVPLVYGTTTVVYAARFEKSCPADRFVRNGDGHELWFVQEGRGLLASEYGVLPFHKGHYLVVPKGTTYRVELESEECHLLMIESRYPIGFAPHYLNKSGQANLTAPVVETETALPEFRPPRDEEGLFRVWTKHGGGFITELFLGHHPFDLIGWEGALYPYAFHTDDHHPLARQIHTAPPTRQTFESGHAPHAGFSVCTFKGQIEGWNPRDVPAPYAHFNADSDEVMFFSNTSYGARKGLVEPGSFTFHPGALPHSPHGMAAKRSFAERGKLSDYLAVMLDTFFEPLSVAKQALPIADKDYPTSWNRDTQGFTGGLMRLDPESLEVRDRYRLLIGMIQPRPIAWVSTISPNGASNLAPFSFFTGICANPMSLCFAPVNDRHGKKKDTLVNIEATKQFVVNLATESNAEKMNQTSAPYPYGVSEFEKAGLTALPSALVKPPRVAESPAAYECELLQIVRLGEGPLAGNLVIGKVVQIHCDDSIYNGGDIRHQDLKTIGRMEGAWYSRTFDAFELPRPEAA